MADFFLGIDLGGTKILTAVADSEGGILFSERIPTEADQGVDRVIENINLSVKTVLNKAGLAKKDIDSVGLGTPGPINIKEGVIYLAPNLYWENVPIVKLLEDKMGIGVKLENDANAATLGEKWFGAGQGIDNLIYLTISTGIGGGIIFDRKIYHGVNDGAGEIGHMIIDPNGPICGCGNPGCLEALASGTAIRRMAHEAIKSGQETLLKDLSNNQVDQIDGQMVAKAASQQDQVALEIWEKVGYYLGIGMANVLNIFNPEMIILGGGVMKAKELFWDKMEQCLQKYAFKSNYQSVRICLADLGDEVGVKGAIAVAMGDRLLK